MKIGMPSLNDLVPKYNLMAEILKCNNIYKYLKIIYYNDYKMINLKFCKIIGYF